ncbi:hypothetical protein ERC79_03870 [Rhodococcus sp. ABRD24]|uniref:hypothetical protein n=1 Tax=Rhodococcus sp. ABRD24 TaxID=2507582 RepID=UPI00103E78D8|nr:hypothetical protein [Rhodococcus sp. ABRD24]QBJ95190.1 hypothetical protein ERC79_03870 [Rhodococcus sp. ABRD24]
MKPGTRTEAEAMTRESSPTDPIDNHLLGTRFAGHVVTTMLVAGIAGAVGIVLASVVALLVTAVGGAVTACLVAYDDELVRRRRRRIRERTVARERVRAQHHTRGGPRESGRGGIGVRNVWSGHSVGRHAA